MNIGYGINGIQNYSKWFNKKKDISNPTHLTLFTLWSEPAETVRFLGLEDFGDNQPEPYHTSGDKINATKTKFRDLAKWINEKKIACVLNLALMSLFWFNVDDFPVLYTN